MDRSLINKTPDLSTLDNSLKERVLTGHNAVLMQVDYFRYKLWPCTKQMEK